MTTTTTYTRDEAIAAIKKALRARSCMMWSVRGGRGTSWGWITVTAPPSRRDAYGGMSDEDRAELSYLAGEPVHHQGIVIPDSSRDRSEWIAKLSRLPVIR